MEEIKAMIEELTSAISELSDKLDEIESTVESAAESGAESGATDAVEDAISSISSGSSPILTIISQDKKQIFSAYGFRAYRIKKGEDPYLINACQTPNGYYQTVGKYPNKEAALDEMKNIAAAVKCALHGGNKFYEIK